MNCPFSKQLMLEVNKDFRISMFHCCVLFDECIDRVTFDEYNSQEDIKSYLTEKYQTNPENHNFHPTNNDCKGSSICDFNNGLSPDFITVSHTCCNLKCKMCTTVKPENPMQADAMFREYLYILNSLKGMKLKHLQLSSAGEPFFRKEKILDFIEKLTLEDTESVGFVSNATLLKRKDIDKMCSTLQEKGINLSATISCDSLNKDIYKKIRGIDALDRVIENIKEFNKFGVINTVNFVIQPDNIDEIESVYKFWTEQNINVRIIYPILHPEWDWMREDPRVVSFKENHSDVFVNN